MPPFCTAMPTSRIQCASEDLAIITRIIVFPHQAWLGGVVVGSMIMIESPKLSGAT